MYNHECGPDSPPGSSPVGRQKGTLPTESYQSDSDDVNNLTDTPQGSDYPSPMDPRTFLAALWGNPPPSEILVWMLPQKLSRWYLSFDHLNQDMAAYPERDVYTGVGYPAPGTTKLLSNFRGEAVDIGAIPGMWADIDVLHPLHKKPNLPPTREQALATLAKTLFEPTIIIDSGHGIQAWWLFDKPWIFEDQEADNREAQKLAQWWNREVKSLYAAEGWDIDSVFDLARVLRVPGTFNNKDPENRAPVTTIKEDGPRYKRLQFLEKVPADFRPTLSVNRSRLSNEVNGHDFLMSPDAEPPHEKLMALLDVDPKFRTTWMGDRSDLKDQSPSAFDMALASMAIRADWNDQETIDLMIAWRRKHGKKLKLREDYYSRTIAKARASVAETGSPGGASQHAARPGKPRRNRVLVDGHNHQFPVWARIGRYVWDLKRIEYVFERRHGGEVWSHYRDGVWYELPQTSTQLHDCLVLERFKLAKHIAGLGDAEAAEAVAVSRNWRSQEFREDFWPGLRSRTDTVPQRARFLVGTPDGVVDPRTLELLRHGRQYGQRALTAGRFLPDDRDRLWVVLTAYLDKVFTRASLQQYLDMIGLAMTGAHKGRRGLLLIVGGSGTGKGGAARLVKRAAGDRGMFVGSDWLERRMQDIDVTGAEILMLQPDVLVVSEMGVETYLNARKVLAMIGGGDGFKARLPLGLNQSGTVEGLWIGTCVEVPRFKTKTGIDRRITVLETKRVLLESEKDEAAGEAQELLDAVVTWALLTVGREGGFFHPGPEGYEPPGGGHDDPSRRVLDEMDPLQTWVDTLPDDSVGRPLVGLAAQAARELADWDINVNETGMGKCVRVSERWSKRRYAVDGEQATRLIHRPAEVSEEAPW